MKIGTKSVLFGAHCFIIHPWFVAAAWWRLYGFPFDPRLWFAFFFHDIGYVGKPNMDGQEGELHPYWGAFVFGAKPSRLCVADKLSIAMTPVWLYLPMVNATGEIHEYLKLSAAREIAGEPSGGQNKKYASMQLSSSTQKEWYSNLQKYMIKWVAKHKDGSEDTWTPNTRKAINSNGVWQ